MDMPDNGDFYSQETLRAFLLGRLPEADAAPMEQRLIKDAAFFSEIQDTEDELIDEYALGALSPTDENALAKRCERQPELAQRLAMRKAFFAALDLPSQQPGKSSSDPLSQTPPNPLSRLRQSQWPLIPGLVPGLAIAASLLLVACIFLLHEKHEAELHLAQLERAQTRPPLHVIERAPAATAAAPVISEVFFPEHASRGAGEQPLQINAAPSRLVEFQLETPAGMPNMQMWTVSITHQHDTLFLQRGLRTQQIGGVSFVRAYVDSSTLDPGSYGVLLSSEAGSLSNHSIRWMLVATK